MNSALPSLQAKASALAWTAAPLAALLTSPPTAYGQAPPQIQNIRERLNAWNSTAPVCDLSGRNLSSPTAEGFSGLSNVRIST